MKALALVRRLPYWIRLVLALGIVVAPVLALCIVVAQDSYQTTENLALSQARSDATLVDVYLGVYLDKYLGILKTLAAEQTQRKYTVPAASDSVQTLLERVALDHPRVYAVVALDSSGKIVASSRREALGLDCSQSDWWRQIGERRAPVVSDFEDSRALGGPVVVLAVPIPGDDGVLALTLNTSTMSTVWEGLLSSGTVLLADTKGVPIVQSNRRELSTAERYDLAKSDGIIPLVRQSTGVTTFRDVPGLGSAQPVIGAGLVDPNYGWSVIAMQDRNTVLGPVRQELLRMLVSLGISLIVSFVIAVLLVGRGPVRRVVLPEISGDGNAGLDAVVDHLRQQADNGLYGEVQLRFRSGRIYKVTVTRERVFD